MAAGAPAPRTLGPAPGVREARRPAAEAPLPGTPVVVGTSAATAARGAQAPVVPPTRGAASAINREIRIADVAVELGEPLPTRPTAERAGSLLASLQRPIAGPRWRL